MRQIWHFQEIAPAFALNQGNKCVILLLPLKSYWIHETSDFCSLLWSLFVSFVLESLYFRVWYYLPNANTMQFNTIIQYHTILHKSCDTMQYWRSVTCACNTPLFVITWLYSVQCTVSLAILSVKMYLFLRYDYKRDNTTNL